MVEVMNAMGYAASAVGNHEFDFGLDVLKTRISEAHFPYVSANLRYQRDNSTPADLGIQPYVVIDVNSLRVGITGLTTYATATSTNPANIKDFTFMDYEAALREIVPQMRAAGSRDHPGSRACLPGGAGPPGEYDQRPGYPVPRSRALRASRIPNKWAIRSL